MSFTVDLILLLAAGVLAVPTLVLGLEVAASLRAKRHIADPPAAPGERPRVAIIIPAHNEEAVLGHTLANLLPQLKPQDRLIVVADNCEDRTAQVAAQMGVTCIERQDPTRRGKGYALDAGVRALAEDPPQVVIFTDADVVVAPGAIDALAQQVLATGRPAQAQYLMDAPANARSVDLVSRFAFTLKNKVRPLGLWQLGLPCPLFGAGMGFTWETISTAPLASGDIVEDMRLGVDLSRNGQAPLFCPQAQFTGVLPADAGDADSQRRRWEHGHLSVFRDAPRLLLGGIRRRDGRMIMMALDHLVQPLTVLCAELLVVLVVALLWWSYRGGQLSATAALVAAGCVLLMGASLFVAWAAHMRRQIPPKALLGLPRYIFSRAGNQAGWLFRPQHEWVRTPRAQERAGEAPAAAPATPAPAPAPAPPAGSATLPLAADLDGDPTAAGAHGPARAVPTSVGDKHSSLIAARE